MVGEFDHTLEDWDSYVERVSLYLVANDIAEEDKIEQPCSHSVDRRLTMSSVTW